MLLVVFGLEHLMYVLQLTIDLLVSNEPEHVQILRERDVYLSRALS